MLFCVCVGVVVWCLCVLFRSLIIGVAVLCFCISCGSLWLFVLSFRVLICICVVGGVL